MAGKGDKNRTTNWKKWCDGYTAAFGRKQTPPPKIEPDAKKEDNKNKCRRPIDRLPEGYDESA